MTGENAIVQIIFDKNFGNKPYGGGTRAGGAWAGPVPEQSEGWAQPGPSRPCSALIRSITEIFIKNILHGHIFPGPFNSLMTLAILFLNVHQNHLTFWILTSVFSVRPYFRRDVMFRC